MNWIDDQCARSAYIEHRRSTMIIMLSLFLVSKFIHLVHLWVILSGEIDSYCKDYEELLVAYPATESGNICLRL